MMSSRTRYGHLHLGVPLLAHVQVDHEVDERSFERGAGAAQHVEARPGQPSAGLHVQDAKAVAQVPVRQRFEVAELGRLAPGAHDHVVGVVDAVGHGGVGDVRDRSERLVALELDSCAAVARRRRSGRAGSRMAASCSGVGLPRIAPLRWFRSARSARPGWSPRARFGRPAPRGRRPRRRLGRAAPAPPASPPGRAASSSTFSMRRRPAWAELREQDHVADRVLIGQQHGQSIDAQPHAAGRRHAVLERDQEVGVERLGLLVAGGACAQLLLEALPLHARVVQLGEGIGELDGAGERLAALHRGRVVRACLGQRRAGEVGRVVG